jgi:hypothetical protein
VGADAETLTFQYLKWTDVKDLKWWATYGEWVPEEFGQELFLRVEIEDPFMRVIV